MHQSEENNVFFIRLVTGEDIISEIIETEIDNKKNYTLFNPMKVVYMMDQKPGMLSISLMKWVFSKICDDQEFDLSPHNILLMKQPSQGLIKHYNESVEHFLERESVIESNTKYDAPIEQQDHMEMFQNQEEDDENISMEELRELIKEQFGSKKRTIH